MKKPEPVRITKALRSLMKTGKKYYDIQNPQTPPVEIEAFSGMYLHTDDGGLWSKVHFVTRYGIDANESLCFRVKRLEAAEG